jgi:hypothetical protein
MYISSIVSFPVTHVVFSTPEACPPPTRSSSLWYAEMFKTGAFNVKFLEVDRLEN